VTADGHDVSDVVGIGVDAVDLSRFRRVLDRRPGLVNRVFGPEERSYAARTVDPVPRLAARFAAKEAVLKALGAGIDRIGLHEVQIVRAESGEPSVELSGHVASLAARRGVRRWHVSLSHTEAIALATAVAEGDGRSVESCRLGGPEP
jgi:holo-[acyl-carrier protein] synthase